jgi:hypothetical protein
MSTPDYVKQIWLLITTKSGTGASLELQVGGPGLDVELFTALLQNTNQNLDELRSAQFSWKPKSTGSQNWPAPAFTADSITKLDLRITGDKSDDAWVPASLWVITQSAVSGYRILSANPAWGGGCFSSQPIDCNGQARPNWPLPILAAPGLLMPPLFDADAVPVGVIAGEQPAGVS